MSIVIPVEELWRLYEYRPLTGELISKKTGRPLAHIVDKDGYLRINLPRRDKKVYCQIQRPYHACVFAWCVGRWPNGQIDHINRNKLDNRLENLRDVTSRVNNINKESHNGGATRAKSGKRQWMAQIHLNGKKEYLGVFYTKEEAQKAYAEALAAIE